MRAEGVAALLLLVACVGQPDDPWSEDGGLSGLDSGLAGVDSSLPPWQPDAASPDAALPPETISATRMHDDVAFLASDELAGRDPGTQGNELAMQYVEGVFAEYGLEPLGDAGTYRQSFSYSTTTAITPSMLVIGGSALHEGTEFALLRGSGSGFVDAEIVFVGHGETAPAYDSSAYPACPLDARGHDDYRGLDVTGKVALVLVRGASGRARLDRDCPARVAAGGPRSVGGRGREVVNARRHGAAAAILVADGQTEPRALARTVSPAASTPGFPVFALDRIAAEERLPSLPQWAKRSDATSGPRGAHTGVEASLAAMTVPTYGEAANIVGAIIGSDPELAGEVILIGGHLDHLGASGSSIYNGADDNASGTAVTMELARMAARSGLVAKRTLIFAGFNAEEMGLIGSCHMADDFMYPLDDLVLMLSLDMVGAGDESGVKLIGGLESKNSWFGDLVSSAADADGLDYEVSESWYSGGSDHACFDSRGVSAMLVMAKGSHPYYHTPSDTIDHIQAGNLEATARMVWAALERLASGEDLR